MGRLLCLIGRHRAMYGLSKSYNLRTGYLRYFYQCRRCGAEMGDA